MTFEEHLRKGTKRPEKMQYHWLDLKRAWNEARRTDPVKAQMLEALKDLQEYTEHDGTCLMAQWRQGVPTDEPGYDGYKNLFGYGKNEKWYGRNDYPSCNCGLREALQKADKAIKAAEEA